MVTPFDEKHHLLVITHLYAKTDKLNDHYATRALTPNASAKNPILLKLLRQRLEPMALPTTDAVTANEPDLGRGVDSHHVVEAQTAQLFAEVSCIAISTIRQHDATEHTCLQSTAKHLQCQI